MFTKFFASLKNIGPSALVTAAFIGPGTVVTASLAGAQYGYALLWAVLFATFATLILQEMAVRVGVATQQGLGENIRTLVTQPWLKITLSALTIAAVVIGNSVYQAGNLSGASLGAAAVVGHADYLPLIFGLLAAIILWQGRARVIERVLIAVVIFMSLAFIGTLLITSPDWSALVEGLVIPSIPSGAALTAVALIGTTVVPYNLFLHAASGAKRWRQVSDLAAAKLDLYISIPIGGLISIAIVATAASAYFANGLAHELSGAADLAVGLEPLFGNKAQWLMAAGLAAAGISSAITAPLASAYALCGLLGWSTDLRSNGFRLVWLSIIGIGVVIASLGLKPVSVIWFAQVANGILLPVMVIFLLAVVNHGRLGAARNSAWQNVMGGSVLLVSLLLSGRSLASAFGWLG